MAATDKPTTADRQTGYADAWIKRVPADNAIEFAYRDLGAGDAALVLLQHFRGNLDNWDPALVDALAAQRRVVAFEAWRQRPGSHRHSTEPKETELEQAS